MIEGNPLFTRFGFAIKQPRFVENLPNDLIEILNKIATEGGGVWLVGGCVRDSMPGQKVKDFDLGGFFTTRNDENFSHPIPTGLDFGCVTLRALSRIMRLPHYVQKWIFRWKKA